MVLHKFRENISYKNIVKAFAFIFFGLDLVSGHSLLKVFTTNSTNFHTRAKRTDEVNSKSVFGMVELIMLLLTG